MLPKFFRRTPLAWLQVTREKTRLLVAIAGITFADMLIFIQMGFEGALFDAAAKPHKNLQADLVMTNPQMQTLFSVKTFSRERLLPWQSNRVARENSNAWYVNNSSD
jgi:putative ABC transport system permease protein